MKSWMVGPCRGMVRPIQARLKTAHTLSFLGFRLVRSSRIRRYGARAAQRVHRLGTVRIRAIAPRLQQHPGHGWYRVHALVRPRSLRSPGRRWDVYNAVDRHFQRPGQPLLRAQRLHRVNPWHPLVRPVARWAPISLLPALNAEDQPIQTISQGGILPPTRGIRQPLGSGVRQDPQLLVRLREPREPQSPQELRDTRGLHNRQCPRKPRDPQPPQDMLPPQDVLPPQDPWPPPELREPRSRRIQRDPQPIRPPREPRKPHDLQLTRPPREPRKPHDPQPQQELGPPRGPHAPYPLRNNVPGYPLPRTALPGTPRAQPCRPLTNLRARTRRSPVSLHASINQSPVSPRVQVSRFPPNPRTRTHQLSVNPRTQISQVSVNPRARTNRPPPNPHRNTPAPKQWTPNHPPRTSPPPASTW